MFFLNNTCFGVFFFKLVFTHVLRTKLSSLELRSLYHELWLHWMVLKQAVLMGTWITMLKCCFNRRVTNLRRFWSNQAVGCSVLSRNQLKSSSDLLFVPWIRKRQGRWPLSPVIFPVRGGWCCWGGVPWDFHEKRHLKGRPFWSWMIMVGMEMKFLSIQNYTKHSWTLGSLKIFVF